MDPNSIHFSAPWDVWLYGKLGTTTFAKHLDRTASAGGERRPRERVTETTANTSALTVLPAIE